ncbi:2-keto-3-deoxygluconate permease [Fenollaria sporofastidiosus]|uniref:2-keto-3-deoxygluconate permease n=1 Tax=Fenollaria sporofastidiosus TaxID=2811778 RepID=UPI001C006A80|nr:2-keto-3-deoxygluconate permease [Fenollaria sporofastidiosus]
MYKFMKKIPGGLLLIPMLISAVFATFCPNLFYIGGLTEALFTKKGINYIVALITFCSATSLDFKSLAKVLKKQGLMLLVKIILCMAFSLLFFKFFGETGVWGISLLSFVCVLASLNPSLYIALTKDYATKTDESAFGLLGLLCLPVFPIIIYSVAQSQAIDFSPIISTLIPLILGILIANFDKDFASIFKGSTTMLTPFMGWSFGTGINLIESFKSGLQGLVLVVIFYVLIALPIYLFEVKVLKGNGVSALGMSSMAGLTVSVPLILSQNSDYLASIAGTAASQIALGVVLTSVITPMLVKMLAKKKGLQINQ